MEYKRNCPECDKKIIYNSKNAKGIYYKARKLNSKCRSCTMSALKKGKSSNRKGCKLTDKQKERMSEILIKRHQENEHPMLGKKHSDETIHKMKKSNGGENNGMYGKKHTKKSKIKMSVARTGKPGPKISDEGLKILRQKRIKEIESDKFNGNQMIPSFNKKSCIFFEKLDNIMNWNGIYATKGNEYKIQELGYFVDYYEPEKNIIIEWDEYRHYNPDGTLKEKDIKRQNEIKKLLKCDVIRIKESNFNEETFITFLKNKYVGNHG